MEKDEEKQENNDQSQEQEEQKDINKCPICHAKYEWVGMLQRYMCNCDMIIL